MDRHDSKPLQISPELTERYTDDRYVSRMPFLLNTIMDDDHNPPSLAREPIENNEVFVGIAGFRALDLILQIGSETKSRYRQAVLFDNNEAHVKAMNGVLHLIGECETAEDFRNAIETLGPRIADHVPKRYSDDIAQKIKADPRHPKHRQLVEDENYFSINGRGLIPDTKEEIAKYFRKNVANRNLFLNEENYQYLRDMVISGRLRTITLDLTDEKRMGRLKENLDTQKLKTRHIYLSSSMATTIIDYKNKAALGERPEHAAHEIIRILNHDNARYLVKMPDTDRSHRRVLKEWDYAELEAESLRDLSHGQSSISKTFANGVRGVTITYGLNKYHPKANDEMPADDLQYYVRSSQLREPLTAEETKRIMDIFEAFPIKDAICSVDNEHKELIGLQLFIPLKTYREFPGILNYLDQKIVASLKEIAPQMRRNDYDGNRGR